MSERVIEARDVGKRFVVGTQRVRYADYATLGDRLTKSVAAMGRRLRGRAPSTEPDPTEFWALRDVGFDVRRGEVVGIIGRNGAGKSTLLKVLSRITEPTTGSVTIRGRIASLLEVGTGFHLELTGRENTFLNGAILGMRRSEIASKFDEIVAFAEVERFIDTPVKHYSSGMHLRLAFAVAAHLEPEILLVDEVLAVGDVGFQQKCIGKMGAVAAQGRTVLFVSHNLGAVRELCDTSIVLDRGRVVFRGAVTDGLGAYSRALAEDAVPTPGRVGFYDVTLNDAPSGEAVTIDGGDPFTVGASVVLDGQVETGRVFCIVESGTGYTVMHHRAEINELRAEDPDASHLRLRVSVPPMWLAPGVYTVYFKLIGARRDGGEVRQFSERATLDVSGSVVGLGKALLAPKAEWTVEAAAPTAARMS